MSYESPQSGQAEARRGEKEWIEQHTPNDPENEGALRQQINQLNEEIAARRASIEKLVAQMQEGEKRAQGNETLKKINASLQGEAQAQKLALLEEVDGLENEKKRVEEKLAGL